jgi:hypothetical protein
MATLFLYAVGSVALRRQSFHQMDLMARQKDVKAWVGSDRRMVASDATYLRILPRMLKSQLREELQQANVLLRQQGHGTLTLPGGRRIRAAAIDGTVVSGRYASVLEAMGGHAAVVDVEPCEGRGKELVAGERLLRRVVKRHGKGFVDIVLGDGLYITEGMLTLSRKLGTHLLVKTQELESLNILKDAEAIFNAGKDFQGDVEHVQGTDVERGMRYEVWAARGFHHGNFSGELKVARVRIQMLKGPRKGRTETFWIVTTDVTLTAGQMRELAHSRWSIENHTFRALNGYMDSKHVWTRGAHAAETFEAWMLIVALSFTLVLAYHAHLDFEKLWEALQLRRVTLGYLGDCWLLSLSTAAGLFRVDG